jgi:DNA-binding NtrC family response regulator
MSQRILVVDDELAIGFALGEYFTLRGYEVDCAVAVKEAQALLRRGSYGALITDLSFSGGRGAEGLELAAFVRRENPGTRTVILTAYGSAEMETEARRLGVDAFLHKPTPLGQIARVLDRVLQAPDSRGGAGHSSGGPPAGEPICSGRT